MKAWMTLVALGASAGFAQSSPFNAQGWGSENSAGDPTSHGLGESGMARRSDRLYDLRLPARSAMDTLTSFSAQMETGISRLDDGNHQNFVSGFSVPQISLCVPMRRWGTLGGSYWQRFNRSFEYQDAGSKTEVLGEGGSYEFAGSYSLRIPFVPWVAASVSYHKLLGRDREMQSYVYSSDDRYTSNTVQDTTETRRNGSYWGGALWLTRPRWDLGFWLSAPGDVDVKTHYKFTTDFIDATEVSSTSRTPLTMGGGAAVRLTARQTLTADVRFTDWTYTFTNATEEWFGGAGWELSGSQDRFSSYWRRMTYRAGGYADVGGPDDLTSLALTGGVGLPLGRLGTMDLALQVGRTSNASGQSTLDETFYKFYVSLTGASVWGNSSRRRR